MTTSATVTAPATLETLRTRCASQRCLVVGSAPLPQPHVDVRAGELVVAVNGGISSVAGDVDIWVCNSRSGPWQHWGAERLRLAELMLAQATGRHVGLIVLLAREDHAPEVTTAHLRAQGTTWDDAVALVPTERRELEQRAGGRASEMEKHALSAGLTAVCLCLASGAAHVRLAGFSWTAGYQYAPGDRAVTIRGHIAGDKAALRRLEARYGTRLEHSLFPDEERTMANQSTRAANPTPTTQKAKDAPGFKVRVKEGCTVWYGNERRREGAVFMLRKASHFKPKVMEQVPDATPIQRIRAADVGRQRQMQLAEAVAGRRLPRLAPNAVDLLPEDKAGSGDVEVGDVVI